MTVDELIEFLEKHRGKKIVSDGGDYITGYIEFDKCYFGVETVYANLSKLDYEGPYLDTEQVKRRQASGREFGPMEEVVVIG